MNKHQIMLTVILSSLLTITLAGGLILLLEPVMAAPAAKNESTQHPQTLTNTLQYVSVSGLAFSPVQQNTGYAKDVRQQLLSLTGQVRTDSNLFIAPLNLPQRSELLGLTVYGQDVDNLGEVRMRLKRCNHGQPFCVALAETTSTTGYNFGPFETSRISVLNETVDNQFYTYFLELDLTALGESGLRSVRLEILPGGEALPPSEINKWALTGSTRSFKLPNTGTTQAKICTDDLSHLNNVTHYPFVIADTQKISLSSKTCITVWGQDIEIRRDLNTGPSSGTYQFLR